MFQTIELMIDSASLGILALLIMHCALSGSYSRKTISALLMLVFTAGMISVSTMAVVEVLYASTYLWVAKVLIVALSPVFIAWGLIELFVDDFEFRPWQIAFVVLSVPTHFLTAYNPIFGIICHTTSLMIYGYLFYIAFVTTKHDLVEERLKFRWWFMTVAAADGLFLTAAHLWYGETNLPVWLHLFKSGSIFALLLIFSYWAFVMRENLWSNEQTARIENPDTLSPAETALLHRLQTSMEDNIWRQEGLTIRKLAESLDAPEHRLRKVINRGLGYRNFAAFVNEYRIGAACEVLADPVKADIPIITIAYEVGYASLGPFNRAFREIVGESPTEYRRRSFAHA